MGQRYYDPALGVFISADPVTARENPLSAFNRYRYATFGEQSANTTARIKAAASPVTSASETQPTTAAGTRDTIISIGNRPIGTFPESVQNRYSGG